MNISGNNRKVAVVGLGYVGLSIATVLARRGVRVFGIDRREEIVSGVNAGNCPVREPGLDDLVRRVVAFGKLTAHTDPGVLGKSQVVILAVGTPLEENYRPDTTQLLAAVDDIAPHLRAGHAVVVKSTVPPGTTRRVAAHLAGKTGLRAGRDLVVACCPERLAEGRMIRDIETIPVVVGGLTPGNTSEVAGFWSGLGWRVIPVSGPEEAEMMKLADNLWIDLNIALANELCMICHRMNVDVLEVISAANTLSKGTGRVNILFPGPGVGGSCLVKDPWFLHHLGQKRGVTLNLPPAGRKTNESMPGFVAGLIREDLQRRGASLEGAGVTVLGLSFKQNTGDTRFSPSLDLVRLLAAEKARVRVHDPWVEAGHAEELLAGLARVEPEIQPAVRGSDAVVFMVGHPEFIKGPDYWKGLLGSRCLMVDCRYIFDPALMTGAGLRYLAPGRRAPGESSGETMLCREY